MKFLYTNKKLTPGISFRLPFQMKSWTEVGFTILTEDKEEMFVTKDLIGYTDGYLRNFDHLPEDIQTQEKETYQEILKGWPLPKNITGTFSTSLLDLNTSEVVLCTDLIGLYPLYYLIEEGALFISNSIILLGIVSGCELDEAGIVQRGIGPEFSNFGSRTILRNCKRLLPGEWIKFNLQGSIAERQFDNSLYQNISTPDQKQDLHYKYWEIYKKEVEYCCGGENEVNVALSGGIDSRIVLAAVPEGKKINCHTFGESKNYEVHLATRLAKIKKANFQNYFDLGLYFPSPEILKKYTLETESLQLCSWLEILENVEVSKKNILVLGELCEALPGRKIERFASRNFREKNFFKYQIFNREYELTEGTSDNFRLWKKKVTKNFDKWYTSNRLSEFDVVIDRNDIIKSLHSDLEEIYDRIEAHDLPYAELYDELFSWYTYTRMRLAKQLTVSSYKFKAYSPAMSLSVLRETTNLHPNLRLNYRFINRLFRKVPELKLFNGIPTSQAPLIPQSAPDLFKFSVWGIRSKIDHYLIKKLMSSKDTTRRYRLFSSINWAMVYRNPDMENNLKSYFHINHLGKKLYQKLLRQSINRRDLKQWPFANIDIINAASLNVELEEILKHRRIGPYQKGEEK